jgi:hypothetical protein
MKSFALLTALAFATLTLTARAEDKKIDVGGNTFTVTAPWTEGKTGMMDKVALDYPVEGGTPMTAKFYEFPGAGGGVESNVKRWHSQFEGGKPAEKRENLKFGDVEVVLVTLDGTFLDGPAMSPNKTPRPDYTMLGAIIVKGDIGTFVKLAGPKAEVAKMADTFKKLVLSPFPAK